MRVLYISYFYPPMGGPAVLRNVKTVKYLAELGIVCDVITIEGAEYLNLDASLLEERGEEELIRTPSADPMSLLKKLRPGGESGPKSIYTGTPEWLKLMVRRMFPIDDKIAWNPYLVRSGRQALARREYDLIYASLGPFSSALGAYRLSRLSGLPLVLDLRDYWNLLSDYDLQGKGLKRKFSLYWEKKVYRHASLIVTATKGIGTDIAAAFGADLAKKILTVYNGWDEADFNGLAGNAEKGAVTLAYFGNLYARRTLKHFYAAVKRLREEGELPAGFRIKLYGNYVREPMQEIGESGIEDLISVVPHLEHREALAKMQSVSILLLVINSSSPRGTLTSKVFEYLRSQRPILGMVPDRGEAAEILRANGHRAICAMESADSIYFCLKEMLDNPGEGFSIPWEFERKRQVQVLGDRLVSMFQNRQQTGK